MKIDVYQKDNCHHQSLCREAAVSTPLFTLSEAVL